jgi:3',5'-cyclic AMP phosphodiesterase CpdA
MSATASAQSSVARALGESIRIVIVGDLHTYRLTVWPWELLGKSLAGQMNLWLNRRKRFDRSLIAPTIARAASLKPDLVLMSGDLTTTARPGEFADIAAALRPLLNSAPAIIVPGNHDVYTFTALRKNRIGAAVEAVVPTSFPFEQPLIGGWRLLAVNSAEPRLLDSRGRIGDRQLRQVETLLRAMPAEHGLVLLCHYPFGKPPEMSPMKTGHRLLDDHRWREVVGTCRGRLVLVHGHVHCPWLWRVQGMPNVLDVNAGAPTMVRRMSATRGGDARHENDLAGGCGQGFWEITLSANAAAPIGFTHHVMVPGRTGNVGDASVSLPHLSGISAAWRSAEPVSDAASGRTWMARHIAV